MLPRSAACALFFAAAALGQENGPIGLLRGDLVSWNGSPRAGQFIFHTADNRTYSCSYDEKTYLERDTQRVTMTSMAKGDRLEIVTDHRAASNTCYALTVHVLDVQRALVVPGVRPRPRTSPTVRDPIFERGDLTFGGVVLRVTADTLILRSRTGEHKTIRLRPDTKYFAEGQTTDAGSLRANTVVFVRAGKNLDDEVEAYQVVWGEMLRPDP